MPERATVSSRSEKSAEAVVVCSQEQAKGLNEKEWFLEGDVLEMASDVRIGGTVRRGRGEAKPVPGSDEDRRPRPHTRSTG